MSKKVEIVGRVPDEMMPQARLMQARVDAVRANPAAYSASETEAIFMTQQRLLGEMIERMSVDDTREWRFSTFSGLVTYEEEY